MENVYTMFPSIERSPLFGRIFSCFALSSSHPAYPRINGLFLKKKERKKKARSFRKRDEIKVAFPGPVCSAEKYSSLCSSRRPRCREQTPSAYEIRMKYLYVCGKQLFTPLPPSPPSRAERVHVTVF